MQKRYKLSQSIKILPLFFLLFLSCSSDGGSGSVESHIQAVEGVSVDQNGQLNITRFGITWIISDPDQNYKYGRFANGDYWTVGPVTIVRILPESTDISGRVMNGSMVNPVPGNRQGYDSACAGDTFSEALNVAPGVSPSNPLVLQNGSSLISTVSFDEAGSRPQLKTAAVLTVLSSIPAEGSFRPPYCGTDKTIQYNVSQLNYSLLASLAPVDQTPALSDIERKFERVWLDHVAGWTGRSIHPSENMPDYGSSMAHDVSDGALMLHLNFTDDQKRTLLIRYVQLGIDNFGIIQSGGIRNWAPDGGHCAGRKWPILFAGLMLNSTAMKNIGQKSGDYLYHYTNYGPGNVPPDYIHFQEDGQTFYVTQADVNITNHYYPPDSADLPEYDTSDIGMPEWGIRHSTNPSWDGNDWNVTYRVINAYSWAGFVLSARIMNADTPVLWNNAALFDYEDRHMAVTALPSLTPAWRYSATSAYSASFIQDIWGSESGQDYSWRTTGEFMENMWDTYRDGY